MKVQVHWRPGTDLQDIYLFRDGYGGKRLQMVLTGPDTWENREIEESQKVEPSLSLPGEVLSQLVQEAMHLLPPDQAQAKHLADAIAVRERILDHFL